MIIYIVIYIYIYIYIIWNMRINIISKLRKNENIGNINNDKIDRWIDR